jgi:raffinose/stachyose/melibiose transport system substrate-binding protein
MMKKTAGTKIVFLSIAIGLIVTGFSACAPKKVAVAPREFKIWHYESETAAMGLAWAEAMKQFQVKHPDVKIVYENKGFEQIRQTAQMILNSEDAPDVMEYNKGNATAGLLSKQGLLTDLTAEATARGWDKILSPSLQTTCRYNTDGVMGSGNWYGVTNYGEYVMVYYNLDLFKKAGLAVPTTFAELESVLAKFAAKKITPIVISGAEYPAQHLFYELALSKADRPMINAYQLYQGNFDFNNPAFTYAANTMVDWLKKGYISKDSISMKAEDLGVAFTNGKAPIMISGSWWYGRFMTEITSFDWSIGLFPGNKMNPGSSGNIWVVPSKAKNKDLAYDFISITLQPDIQALLGNKGGIPVNADISKIDNPKVKELISLFTKLNAEDGIAFYPDWPAAGFYDALVSNIQDLLLGKDTTKVFLDSLNKAYKEGK